jgi:hypothetical protein
LPDLTFHTWKTDQRSTPFNRYQMPQRNVPPIAAEFAEDSDRIDEDPGVAGTVDSETVELDESARSERNASGYAVVILAVV